MTTWRVDHSRDGFTKADCGCPCVFGATFHATTCPAFACTCQPEARHHSHACPRYVEWTGEGIVEDAPMPAYDGDPDGRRADEAAADWENRWERQAGWAS